MFFEYFVLLGGGYYFYLYFELGRLANMQPGQIRGKYAIIF